MDIITEAWHAWIEGGKPEVELPHERKTPIAYGRQEAWASRLGGCPYRHACERTKAKPIFPDLQEFAPNTQWLFSIGLAVEAMWAKVLAYSHKVQLQVPIIGSGISGKIDVMLPEVGKRGTPVEIKRTAQMRRGYLLQCVGYLQAGSWDRMWLILDHADGEFDVIRVEYHDNVFTAYHGDLDRRVLSRGQPYEIAAADFRKLVALHQAAILPKANPECRLPMLTTWQCVKLTEGGTLAEVMCPWFCWETSPTDVYDVVQKRVILQDGTGLPVAQGEGF